MELNYHPGWDLPIGVLSLFPSSLSGDIVLVPSLAPTMPYSLPPAALRLVPTGGAITHAGSGRPWVDTGRCGGRGRRGGH
jgi:hypothetical protein